MAPDPTSGKLASLSDMNSTACVTGWRKREGQGQLRNRRLRLAYAMQARHTTVRTRRGAGQAQFILRDGVSDKGTACCGLRSYRYGVCPRRCLCKVRQGKPMATDQFNWDA